MPHTYTLERTQLIARPLAEVFAFFADAGNLEEITPGWLHFQFVTPLPIEVKPGALIDYRLRLCGVPFSWRTRIETFVPNESFTDVQIRGPYRLWHHLHQFRETLEGTLMLDRVDYQMPMGVFGQAALALFVKGMLERIFDYRCERTAELLGRESLEKPANPTLANINES